MTITLTPSSTQLLASGAADLAEHRRLHGDLPWQGGPGRLTATLEASGLTGRGGAGFPTWRKVASSAAASGRSAVVIANGAEGEPASSKDAVLLAAAPHLVLDGAQRLGRTAGQVEQLAEADAVLGLHHSRPDDRAAQGGQEGAGLGLRSGGAEPGHPVPRDQGQVRQGLHVLHQGRSAVHPAFGDQVALGPRQRRPALDRRHRGGLLAGDEPLGRLHDLHPPPPSRLRP